MASVSNILELLKKRDPRGIAQAITLVENDAEGADSVLDSLDRKLIDAALVLGITGPPGAGKSTLTDALVSLYRQQGIRVGVVAIDPSSPLTGGAILGDRVRMMRHAVDPDVVMRSMATRGMLGGLCGSVGAVVRILASCGCSVIIIETVGVGQSEVDIVKLADLTVLVMAPGLGDDIQAMKAGLLEVVDLIVVNKADSSGAEAAAMDMEAVLRERPGGSENSRVCLTIASTGDGVEALVEQIDQLDKTLRTSGSHKKIRHLSFKQEVVDWALQIFKERAARAIEQIEFDNNCTNPRLEAERLLRDINNTKKSDNG